MTRVALSLHLLAVVLAVGPVTMAASLFPAVLRREGPSPLTAFLHRTCRVYGVVGLAAPAFGVITAARLGVLTEGWVLTSMALTLGAALLLALVVLPAQRRALDGAPLAGGGRRLAGATGIFSLLWAAVLVLMVFRPGSTLGA